VSTRSIRYLVLAVSAALIVTGCGRGDGRAERAGADQPSIVVTTSILGDVVSSMVGDAAEVTTIMPAGASPHDFQASAQQAQQMREADLLVVNGARFEEGMLDVIEAAERDGVQVYEAISAVDTINFADAHEHAGAEHAGEGDKHAGKGGEHASKGDERAGEGDGHDRSGVDPHFFTDPARMAVAAQAILDELTEHVPALDTDDVRKRAKAYISELEALDAEVERVLAVIPAEDRVLVTNHEVFGYFADRYGFEVVGTVIPGGTTAEGGSSTNLAELVEVIKDKGVPAIFADTSSPDQLAQTLAAEVGSVEVVDLYSESLGEPGSGAETYLQMVRTNAERIADALT
jgi:zinc/manganese transport system substrate-binding protein